ncbi:MAG: chemotaxis protein CheW [Bacillota bacterium]
MGDKNINLDMDYDVLDIVDQQRTDTEAGSQFVTFKIGKESYGVNVMLVQEIIRYNQPTRMHRASPEIKGLINFRGKVIPVIDMHKKFDIPAVEYDRYTVVIILEVSGKTMGIIVERVSDIVRFEEEKIQKVDKEFAEDMQTKYIIGMAKKDENIIMIVDPQNLLSIDKLENINVNAKNKQKI